MDYDDLFADVWNHKRCFDQVSILNEYAKKVKFYAIVLRKEG